MRKIIIGVIIIAIAIGVYTGVSMFMEKNKWVCENGEREWRMGKIWKPDDELRIPIVFGEQKL